MMVSLVVVLLVSCSGFFGINLLPVTIVGVGIVVMVSFCGASKSDSPASL